MTLADFEETRITYANAKDHLTGKVAACNLDRPNSVYVCLLSSTSQTFEIQAQTADGLAAEKAMQEEEQKRLKALRDKEQKKKRASELAKRNSRACASSCSSGDVLVGGGPEQSGKKKRKSVAGSLPKGRSANPTKHQLRAVTRELEDYFDANKHLIANDPRPEVDRVGDYVQTFETHKRYFSRPERIKRLQTQSSMLEVNI